MKRSLLLGTLVAAVVLAAPAFGQSSAYYVQQRGMDERFRLDVGGFFQDFSTTLSLSNAAGTVGTEVNLEDDLGQDPHQTNLAVDGYYRFGPHGRLDFSYRGWNRSNTHTLSRDIVFGDTTYHVGATVDSRLRVTLAEIYYAYSFINNGDTELGLGLGFSTYFTTAELDGTGTFSGPGGTQQTSVSTSGHALVAPIPSIKGYFVYTLYPRLFFSVAAKGITATINGYHASMQDYRGGLDWVFTKSVGVGAKYQYVKISFSHSGSAGDLGLTYRYDGPLAYVIIAF
jgi:hypothetical protein